MKGSQGRCGKRVTSILLQPKLYMSERLSCRRGVFVGERFSGGIKPGLPAPPPDKTKADHEDDSKILFGEKEDN